MIFSLRISKLGAFTQQKKKKNTFLDDKLCWKKNMELNVGSFFCFCLQGFFLPLSLLFTKQNNSKVNFISNFEKRLVTSKNIYVFIFLFSEKSLKEA
jgi:hypothetical protein